MLLLATFPSSQAALRAEQRLKREGLKVELIPVPRQIRSTCGFCLLCSIEGPFPDLGEEGLWQVLDAERGPTRRRYEPYFQDR